MVGAASSPGRRNCQCRKVRAIIVLGLAKSSDRGPLRVLGRYNLRFRVPVAEIRRPLSM